MYFDDQVSKNSAKDIITYILKITSRIFKNIVLKIFHVSALKSMVEILWKLLIFRQKSTHEINS